MKQYIKPTINICLFNEEPILTLSAARYASDQLNEYMFGTGDVKSTTTISITDVTVNGGE